MQGKKIEYSKAELDFIRRNSKLPRKEMTEKFNKKFNRDVSQVNLSSLCKRNGWYTGRTGQFRRGEPSWNAGKKGLRFKGSEKGWFPKGNKPENTLPVGTEIFADGWVKVKVAEPNKWKSKARIVWEEQNGTIPDGHVVLHIDSDPTNNNIENLELISRAELSQLNKKGFHEEPLVLRPVLINHEHLNERIRTLRSK